MAFVASLRMKPLPKAEYYRMRKLLKQFDLSTEQTNQLFAILIRLCDEVLRYDYPHGEQWVVRIIDEVKSGQAMYTEE